jgi:amphiphysin
MTSAQSRIAETLETFYGAADSSSEGAMAGHAYKRSVDDMDTTFTRELVRLNHHEIPNIVHTTHSQDVPFRTTISEPLGKMCAYFPVVNEHIAKRNKKVSVILHLRLHFRLNSVSLASGLRLGEE